MRSHFLHFSIQDSNNHVSVLDCWEPVSNYYGCPSFAGLLENKVKNCCCRQSTSRHTHWFFCCLTTPKIVQESPTLSKACWTTDSDSVSRADVASSKRRILGFLTRALAIAIRCFWPPLNCAPRSPTNVSNFWKHKIPLPDFILKNEAQDMAFITTAFVYSRQVTHQWTRMHLHCGQLSLFPRW